MAEIVRIPANKLGMTEAEAKLATEASAKILNFAYGVLDGPDAGEEFRLMPEWAAKSGMETGLALACNIAGFSYVTMGSISDVPRLMQAARRAIIAEIDAINKENAARN